jgi:hypothetical protein
MAADVDRALRQVVRIFGRRHEAAAGAYVAQLASEGRYRRVEMHRAVASLRVGDRPDRVEPRVVKRRPKAYPRMQEPREAFKERVAKAG